MQLTFTTGKDSKPVALPVIAMAGESVAPLKAAISVASEAMYDAYERDYYSRDFIGSSDVGQVSPINWYRQAVRAEKLAQQNGVYHRILEIMRDHTFGNGIKEKCATSDTKLSNIEPSVSEVIRKGFFGKINRCDLKVPQWIYERFMVGETVLPARLNKTNGFVEIGYLPARWIQDIIIDKRNVANVKAIKVQQGEWLFNSKSPDGGEMEWAEDCDPDLYKIIAYDRDPILLSPEGKPILDSANQTQTNPNQGKLSGDVFYFRSGNLLGQKRGQGDCFPIADWVITLEQGIRDFLSRYDAQASLVYDLLIKGASEDEIRDKYSKIVLPVGRIPFAHNESVVLSMHSPTLKIEDLTSFIRTLVVLISGAAGIPEFMMGDGSQTNVATAKEQAPALYAKFQNRRSQFEAEYEMICQYLVQSANDAEMLYVTNDDGTKGEKIHLTSEQLDTFDVGIIFMPFERTNPKEQADTITANVNSIRSCETFGYIDHESAAQLAQSQLTPLGFKITTETATAQIEEERDDQMQGMGASGAAIDMSALKGAKS